MHECVVKARRRTTHLREFPAATTNAYGRGRVTYIGTVPDRELAAGLAGYVAEVSVTPDPWRSARPPSTTCTTSVAADGRVLRFVHNWSWAPAQLTLPRDMIDILAESEASTRDLELGPWDVRVLAE